MLRIMSLNLNYRVAKHGAWSDRRTLIAQTARSRQVDVMALQAVEGNAGRSQAGELAELLGFAHVAFVAAAKEGDVGRGSALVSRYPLRNVDVRQLSCRPHQEDQNRRVVLRAHVEANGGVELYNAHFSWVSPQAVDNARETLEFCAARAGLLLGDLNSSPDSPALEVLRAGGWVDLWPRWHGDDPGFTFEADRPTQRIDYALATRGMPPRVRALERVDADGAAPPRLSDHLGLLVTLDTGAGHAPSAGASRRTHE